jgi:hypothetical protein
VCLEDGSCRHRCLRTARRAFQQCPADRPRFATSATRTAEARGFSEYDQRVRSLLRWVGLSDGVKGSFTSSPPSALPSFSVRGTGLEIARPTARDNPICTQRLITEDDTGRAKHEEILFMLAEGFGPDSFKVCDLPRKLSSESFEALTQITGHKSGEPFSQYKVGQFFARHLRDRWFGKYRLVKTGKIPNGKSEWRIESKGGYPPHRHEDPM